MKASQFTKFKLFQVVSVSFLTSVFIPCHTTIARCEISEQFNAAENELIDKGSISNEEKKLFRREWIKKLTLFVSKEDSDKICYTEALSHLVPLLSSDGQYKKAAEMNDLLVQAMHGNPQQLYWALNLAELNFLLYKTGSSESTKLQAAMASAKVNELLQVDASLQGVAHRIPSFLFEQMSFFESNKQTEMALTAALKAIELNSNRKIDLSQSPWKPEFFLLKASKFAAQNEMLDFAKNLYNDAINLNLSTDDIIELEAVARAIDPELGKTYQEMLQAAANKTTAIDQLWLLQKLVKAFIQNGEYVAAANTSKLIILKLDENTLEENEETLKAFKQDAVEMLDLSITSLDNQRNSKIHQTNEAKPN